MEEIIIYSIETLALLLYVYYLVWDYSAKEVPFYVKALTYLSWIMTFSIVMILPIDIANSFRQRSEVIREETYDTLLVVWRTMYWVNFLLSWLILPFFQDYNDSGDFTIKDRMRYSIKKNLLIYSCGLILGILLIAYLAFKKQMEMSNIEGVLAGLGNVLQISYLFSGLLLVVILLGFGLVAIPKRYIIESNEEAVLQQCYNDAVLLDEARTERLYELEEMCRVLFLLESEFQNTEFHQYLLLILNSIPDDFKSNLKKSIGSYNASTLLDQYKPLSLQVLGNLNRNIKRLMFDMNRLDTKFKEIANKALKLEKKQISDDMEFQTRLEMIYFKIAYIWNLKIRKYVNKYIGYFFAAISVLILISEICVLLDLSINLNVLNLILVRINGFWWTQLFLIIPLMYMSFCTYYGLFALKISGLISFNKNHHTDAPSLMFGSINFGRIAFPLCYNFIQVTIVTETSYSDYIGNMNIIPIFGKGFSTILPLMLIIMCVFNLFNIGNKIMKAVGLGNYAQKELEEGGQEGKKILDRGRQYIQINQERESKSTIASSQEMAPYSAKKLVPDIQPQLQQQFAIKNFDDILNI